MDGGTAVTGGCFVEKNNATGREIEVCACQSKAGDYPCNSANSIFTFNMTLFSIIAIFLIKFIVIKIQ